MNKEVPSLLIDKYLKGECSAEEAERVIAWYDSLQDDVDPIAELPEDKKVALKESMLENIRHAAYPARQSKAQRYYLYAALSGVAAMLLVVFNFYLPAESGKASQPVARLEASSSREVNLTNYKPRMVRCVLPDNSIVWLKQNASIKYNKRTFREARTLELKGEAFFDVVKDKKHPFSIQSGKVVTTVLGTSFNIKSTDQETEVSVVTGKVMVATEDKDRKEVYVLPKQKVVYLVKEESLVKNQIKGNALNIWTKNDLRFDNASVSSIIKVLNAEFKTQIQVADPTIESYTLTADFSSVNLPTVLELLSKSLAIQYEMKGDKISIYNTKPLTN